MSAQPRPDVLAHGYRALLANRSYCTLLGSVVLMAAGQGLYMTVLPWLALEVTGSNSAVGWSMTAMFLPYLLLAVPAGAVVDRLDRRRMMVAVSLLRASLAAVVPLLYTAHLLTGWPTLLHTFLLSAAGLLYYLGRCSVLPAIVPQEELVTANSANVLATGLAMIGGTALVGPVVRVLGLANSFAVFAATLALSAALVATMQLPAQALQPEEEHHLTWQDLVQGLSYVWRDAVIRGVFLLDALYFILADGMVMTGIPLFVKDVLQAGPEAYGYIRSAGNVGMLLGALWLGGFGRSLRKERVIVFGWLGYGLALSSYPLFPSLAPAVAASFFANMIGNLIPTCGSALLQERVPQELLGRVFGVWNMLAPGAGSFSGMLGGVLAGVLPASSLIALGAAVSCGNAVLGRVGGVWAAGAEGKRE